LAQGAVTIPPSAHHIEAFKSESRGVNVPVTCGAGFLVSVFRQLLASGLLETDVQAYGALKLTDAARPVLKGEMALTLRRYIARAKGKATKTGATRKGAGAQVTSHDTPCFEALRAWRGEKAREQGVPAYVILHDRTLAELASQRPQSTAALLQVPGIGLAKAERYGEALLALLTEAA